MGNACTNCNCAKEGDPQEMLTMDSKSQVNIFFSSLIGFFLKADRLFRTRHASFLAKHVENNPYSKFYKRLCDSKTNRLVASSDGRRAAKPRNPGTAALLWADPAGGEGRGGFQERGCLQGAVAGQCQAWLWRLGLA